VDPGGKRYFIEESSLSTLSLTTGPGGEDLFDNITTALAGPGYIVLPSPLPDTLADSLFIHFTSLNEANFKHAGIGRETNHRINPFVRGDRIAWVETTHPAIVEYLDWIEQLRLVINRRLFLGLFDYECQYAWYPQGAFYKKHLDAFKGENNRIVSTVLYLNPDWQAQDGGELLLYTAGSDKAIETITPLYGKMAIFLSEEFPHEVARTNKLRRSITGWFRINNHSGIVVDPPA
jgi:SM-20-related protein